jgi:hypothetical protein
MAPHPELKYHLFIRLGAMPMRFQRMSGLIVTSFLYALAMTADVAAASASCGQYMYYEDGKCRDARNKPRSHWTKRDLDKNFSSAYW